MAGSALETYLNDHLAGAMFGSDLAEQIRARTEETRIGDLMASLAQQIEEDRQSLVGLMERMGISQSQVKQATTWLAEKASRVKLGGMTAAETGLSMLMALETLTLGVAGKRALWAALSAVEGEHPELNAAELDVLISRAESQQRLLERERVEAGRTALGGDVGGTALGGDERRSTIAAGRIGVAGSIVCAR
jgi:hypothetical protein